VSTSCDQVIKEPEGKGKLCNASALALQSLILIRDVMMIDHRFFLGKKTVSDIPRCSFLWLYLSQTMLRYIWGTSWLGRKCFKHHKYDPRSGYQSQWFFLPWGKSTANLDLPRLSFLAGYPKTSLTSHSTGVTESGDQGSRQWDPLGVFATSSPATLVQLENTIIEIPRKTHAEKNWSKLWTISYFIPSPFFWP